MNKYRVQTQVIRPVSLYESCRILILISTPCTIVESFFFFLADLLSGSKQWFRWPRLMLPQLPYQPLIQLIIYIDFFLAEWSTILMMRTRCGICTNISWTYFLVQKSRLLQRLMDLGRVLHDDYAGWTQVI